MDTLLIWNGISPLGAAGSMFTAHLKWLTHPIGGGRHDFCDGIRGWASIVVAIHHIFSVYGLMPMNAQQRYGPLLDATFSVAVFFGLSGFSLCCIGTDEGVVRATIGRWPRLALPCIFHGILSTIVRGDGVLRALTKLSYSVATSFFPFDRAHTPSAVLHMYDVSKTDQFQLWTMEYEFRASMIIFFYLLARQHVTTSLRPVHTALAMGCIFVNGPVMCMFAVGVIWQNRWDPVDAPVRGTFAALAVVALSFTPLQIWTWSWSAVAVIRLWCLFECCHYCGYARAALSCRLSVFLGRISFSLYLCHVYTALVVMYIGGQTARGVAISTAAAILVAVLSSPVDHASMEVARYISRSMMSIVPPVATETTPSCEA